MRPSITNRPPESLPLVLAVAMVGGVVVLPPPVAGPVQVSDGAVAIERSSYVQERGDTFEVTVELSNTTRAYVEVGSPGAAYHSVLKLTDRDGDGVVTFALNTYDARRNLRTGGVASAGDSSGAADGVSVVRLSAPTDPTSAPLPRGSYGLRVATGYDAAFRELVDVQDSATLRVVSRSTNDVRVLTGPRRALGFSTPSEFRERFDAAGVDDHLWATDRIADGDFVVVRFDVSGVYGLVRNRNDLLGIDATGDPTGLRVTVEEVDPGGDRPPRRIDLADPDNVVLTDDANNTMYLVLSTATEVLDPGSTYRATFELNETSPLVRDTSPDPERETLSTTFVVVERRARLVDPREGEPLVADRAGVVEVRGTTTLAPGTEVVVKLRSTGGEPPFLRSDLVRVSPNRTFGVHFDVSGVPNGSNARLSVADFDATLTRANVTVVSDPATPTPRPTPTPTSTPTATPSPTPTPEPITDQERSLSTSRSPTAWTSSTATTTKDRTAGGPVSGFGVLVVLVAVLTVALLALRRQE